MIKKALIKKKVLLVGLFFIILIIGTAAVALGASSSTADVAYIYRKESKIDDNVLDVFDDMGLSVDLIDEKYLPNDFSDYKFIFVGDERFKNENRIPVNNYPSIITNYYYGNEWGLTDQDGISKLGSNSPLNVRKNGQIIQVYTQALYPSIQVSIPYYYLDDENKAEDMQSIARTYIGNDYDFGDVISYANTGARLSNGKQAGGNICFFGLATYQSGVHSELAHSSNYWTSATRNMFEDCIGFVSITCYDDDDCPDEEIGDLYCQDGNVYQDIEQFECENPGTVDSECIDDIISELVEICVFGCANGECLPECSDDSDCPDDFYSDNYCSGNDVVRDLHDFSCEQGECVEQVVQETVGECEFECVDGECVNGTHDVALTLDGKEIKRGKTFRYGHRHRLEGTDLIVWIQTESIKRTSAVLSPIE